MKNNCVYFKNKYKNTCFALKNVRPLYYRNAEASRENTRHLLLPVLIFSFYNLKYKHHENRRN